MSLSDDITTIAELAASCRAFADMIETADIGELTFSISNNSLLIHVRSVEELHATTAQFGGLDMFEQILHGSTLLFKRDAGPCHLTFAGPAKLLCETVTVEEVVERTIVRLREPVTA